MPVMIRGGRKFYNVCYSNSSAVRLLAGVVASVVRLSAGRNVFALNRRNAVRPPLAHLAVRLRSLAPIGQRRARVIQ